MTKQIEKLALELFTGRVVRTKAGRPRHEYLSGSRERQAKIALARWQPEEPDARLIKIMLTVALTGIGGRQLIFQSSRRGRPSTHFADARIDRYVTDKMKTGCPAEAAVAYAVEEFGLSRKAIFAARRRQHPRRKNRPVSFNQD
jgi:hypothetical protein